MEWTRILAYISGTVDQELLLRNEYLAAENQILRAQIRGRLLLSDGEKKTLAATVFRSPRTEGAPRCGKTLFAPIWLFLPGPTSSPWKCSRFAGGSLTTFCSVRHEVARVFIKEV